MDPFAQVDAKPVDHAWLKIQSRGMAGQEKDLWLWKLIQAGLGLQSSQLITVVWGGEPSARDSGGLEIRVLRFPQRLRTAEQLRLDIAEVDSLMLAISTTRNASRTIPVDIFSWIEWLVTRSEEYAPGARDIHERFPLERSMLYELGSHRVPVVDVFVDLLRDSITRAARAAGIRTRRLRPWPAGKRFALCLSHDLDNAEPRSLLSGGRKLLGSAAAMVRGDASASARRRSEGIGLILGGSRNPYWLTDDISAIERTRSISSTIFILPHVNQMVLEGSTKRRRYDIRSAKIGRLLARVHRDGNEFGLHSSYRSFDFPAELEGEWKRVSEVLQGISTLSGIRTHYLRFRVPETWRYAARLGATYDSSLGWASDWGFRSGTCMPYRPFDLELREEVPLWELDLNLMDVAVRPSELVSAVQGLATRVERAGGCASILVHPTPYGGLTAREYLVLYRSLLDAVERFETAWITTPTGVVEAMSSYERLVTGPRQ
jgi:hypothetical protein